MDTDHDKIIRVEEKLESLSGVVLQIRDNHLVHIKQEVDKIHSKVDSLDVKMAMYMGAIGVVVWAIGKFL